MESYQWQYQPTPEELKSSKIVPRLLGGAIYLSGFIYFLVYYFNEDSTQNFGISLAIVYVLEIILWNFWLKKVLHFGRTAYDIGPEGITINHLETNRKQFYKWDQMESYSTTAYSSSRNLGKKNLYVSTGKSSSGKGSEGVYKYFVLWVTEDQKKKVEEILASRLKKWEA